MNVIITLGLKNSKTSPGALFLWEAWEVISSAKIRLFSEQTNFLHPFFKNLSRFLLILKLKTQAIWMLTIEWLEKEQKCVIDNRKEIVAKLNPIFYNDETEASSFLSEIQGMKAKQITDRVNQLVRQRVISEMSRKRELWLVLHDYGLYDKSESNWNSQVF